MNRPDINHPLLSHSSDRSSLKEAILVVAYGTSTSSGKQIYSQYEEIVKDRYPDIPVVWAYTSSKALEAPEQQHKATAKSVHQALMELDNQGISLVTVLPLYVVCGSAYNALEDELTETLPLLNLHQFELAAPLIHEARDADIISTALLNSLPEEDECPDRILFMGHGSSVESGNAAYDDVDDLLDRTFSGARLALLEGDSFETLLAEWGEALPGERVLLRPFFFTIGKHSLNDLAGPDKNSWKSRLEAMGYTCEIDMISLGTLPEVQELVIQHLDRAYRELHDQN